MNEQKSNKVIGYLIPEFPQQTHIFFWREAQALEKLGYCVKYISTRKSDLSLVKHAFAKPASESCFYLHPISIFDVIKVAKRPIWFLRALMYIHSLDESPRQKIVAVYFAVLASRLIDWCRANNVTHIHGHSCANVAHILAMCRLDGLITYSLTLHGGLSTYGKSHRQKMAHASFVSTVTRPLHDVLVKKLGIPSDKVPIISMGVDLSRFSAGSRSYKNDGTITFITVARLAIGKGHTFSLEAIKDLIELGHQCLYVVIGGGPDESLIKQDVMRLGLQEVVQFTGSLGEEEILTHLENADVHLLTSFGGFEAAPVCVMEAMASGLPTITSIIGGTKDMVEDGKDGFLVEQKDVGQIKESMQKFFDDKTLLETMGRNARASAEAKFDFMKQAEKLAMMICQSSR